MSLSMALEETDRKHSGLQQAASHSRAATGETWRGLTYRQELGQEKRSSPHVRHVIRAVDAHI